MRSVLRIFEVELRSACDNIKLMVDIFINNLPERENFRLAVYKRQLNNAVRNLQLRVRIKLI